MTIEEKAKAYNEVVNKLRRFMEQGIDPLITRADAQDFFPELVESEGEKIRKWCISHFKECINVIKDNDEYKEYLSNKVLAWLEKQTEQKPNPYTGVSFEYNGHIWGMCARDNGVDILLDKQLFKHLEKQDEQKEINLVEILKHYPKETELYSPLYGKLWLAEVDEKNEIITCYKHHLEEGCTRAVLEQEDTVSFYSNGTTGLPDFNISKDCMLFLYDIEKQGEKKSIDGLTPQEAMDIAVAKCFEQGGQKPTWKPSDEQMEALKAMTRYCDIATSFDAYKQRIVESLYSELKKLKEE